MKKLPTEVLLVTQEQYEQYQGWTPNDGLDSVNFGKDGNGNWVATLNMRENEDNRERFAEIMWFFDSLPVIPFVPIPDIEP